MVKRCYCQGTICGRDELKDGDRTIHFNAMIVWGADDLRAPWSGSYDFGSFACVAKWAGDRSDSHDGLVLADGVDPHPVEPAVPPAGEETVKVTPPEVIGP